MSIIPLLLSLDSYNPWEGQAHGQRSNRIISDLNLLNLGLTPYEIQILTNLPSVRSARKRKSEDRLEDLKRLAGDDLQPQVGKNGFQVLMNVDHFRPSEIAVKTVDNTVIVEGKHEERQDEHGSISRQFLRKYQLPKGYDATDVVSTLSSDGVLTIKAPPPQKSSSGKERVIQIQQTGPAYLNIKENPAREQNKGK